MVMFKRGIWQQGENQVQVLMRALVKRRLQEILGVMLCNASKSLCYLRNSGVLSVREDKDMGHVFLLEVKQSTLPLYDDIITPTV